MSPFSGNNQLSLCALTLAFEGNEWPPILLLAQSLFLSFIPQHVDIFNYYLSKQSHKQNKESIIFTDKFEFFSTMNIWMRSALFRLKNSGWKMAIGRIRRHHCKNKSLWKISPKRDEEFPACRNSRRCKSKSKNTESSQGLGLESLTSQFLSAIFWGDLISSFVNLLLCGLLIIEFPQSVSSFKAMK